MNIFFLTLIIFVIVYFLLNWFVKTSSKKISNGIRTITIILSVILAITMAYAGRFLFSLPFLLMVFRAEAESLRVIHLFSSGIKKRFLIKLTSNLLLVLFRDLETLFPNITFFPVISQVLDIFQTYLQRAKLNYLDLIKKLFLVLNYCIYKEF